MKGNKKNWKTVFDTKSLEKSPSGGFGDELFKKFHRKILPCYYIRSLSGVLKVDLWPKFKFARKALKMLSAKSGCVSKIREKFEPENARHFKAQRYHVGISSTKDSDNKSSWQFRGVLTAFQKLNFVF